MPSLKIMCLLCTGVLAASVCLAQEKALAKSITLDNLQAAYNGESNAKARYEAFAAKADEEGYKSVASAFRAAARSEELHAQKHAKQIEKLGGKPTATIEKAEVGTTAQNL